MEIYSGHFKRAFFFTLHDLDSDDDPYSRNINRKIEPKLKIYKKYHLIYTDIAFY